MTGQIFGWAVNEPVSTPPKSVGPTVPSSPSSTYGKWPSSRARILPAWPTTWVLAFDARMSIADRGVEDVERRVGDERRLHVAVAVPLGPAVAQAHAVHHAVAEERVGARAGERVGAVADVAAVELGRERAR